MARHTPPPSSGSYRPLEPHEWLKQVRNDKGIRQDQVEAFTSELGPKARISQSHLSKIERGYASLQDLGPQRMDALRRALRLSVEEWTTHTGLTIVTPAEAQEIELPDALREASARFGPMAEFADLADPAWLQLLSTASPFDWDGPETPEEWLAFYMSVRNHTKPRRR